MPRAATAAAVVMAMLVAAAAALPRHGRVAAFDPGAMVAVHTPGRDRPLHVMRHEVSHAAWQACHAAGACSHMPRMTFKGDPRRYPAAGINAFDAREFIAWANRGGTNYRPPTPEEWRALAGAVLPPEPPPRFTDPRLAWAARYGADRPVSAKLEPLGSFTVSPDGIADLDGNVWEWTSGCVSPAFDRDSCPAFLALGAHEAVVSVFVRDPATGGCAAGTPPANLGLRLVADTAPGG